MREREGGRERGGERRRNGEGERGRVRGRERLGRMLKRQRRGSSSVNVPRDKCFCCRNTHGFVHLLPDSIRVLLGFGNLRGRLLEDGRCLHDLLQRLFNHGGRLVD